MHNFTRNSSSSFSKLNWFFPFDFQFHSLFASGARFTLRIGHAGPWNRSRSHEIRWVRLVARLFIFGNDCCPIRYGSWVVSPVCRSMCTFRLPFFLCVREIFWSFDVRVSGANRSSEFIYIRVLLLAVDGAAKRRGILSAEPYALIRDQFGARSQINTQSPLTNFVCVGPQAIRCI